MPTNLDDIAGLKSGLRKALTAKAPPAPLPGLGSDSRSAYAFEPDPQIRMRLVRETADLMAKGNPEGAKALASADVFQALRQAMGDQGLSIDNLADAFAAYLAQFWELANGFAREPDAKRLHALSRQVAAALDEAMTEDQRGDPRVLQELSDALAVQLFVYGITAYRLTTDWKGKTREIAENYGELARQMLGIDLALMTYDENGLVARSADAFLAEKTVLHA